MILRLATRANRRAPSPRPSAPRGGEGKHFKGHLSHKYSLSPPRGEGQGEEFSELLQRLARLHGIQISYTDMSGKRQDTSPEVLKAVLNCLGVEVHDAADIQQASAEAVAAKWRQCFDSVVVAWNGMPAIAEVRLPEN